MKTRNELINYFMNNFTESQFTSKEQHYKMLTDKTTEELSNLYKRDQLRKHNEQELYKHGADAYKIEYSQDDRMKIFYYMRDHAMFKFYDNEISYYFLDSGELMYYVPLKFVEELEQHFNIKRLDHIHILGKKELSNFSVGDKVKIKFNNWYSDTVEQGTVHSINDDEIVIRKYRARTTGFTFKVGEECNIEKINSFVKVS